MVDVKAFLSAKAATSGVLSLDMAWSAKEERPAELTEGDSMQTLAVEASAKDVKLWLPAGMGKQALCRMNVTFKPKAGVAMSISRRVGLRYFVLVNGNDTGTLFVEKVKMEQGSEAHRVYFRVTGGVTWSRGANMIPKEELEGRIVAGAHYTVVQSAVDSGVNTLRVWGGGTFLSDEWYDAAGGFGVLVYHDMQYMDERGHSPEQSDLQERELRLQVRRLSVHPSVLIWEGCNECQVIMDSSSDIYAKLILKVVVEEDKSRSVRPSSPASRWKSGVRKLDSLPTGDGRVTIESFAGLEVYGDYSPSSKNSPMRPLIPSLFEESPTGPRSQNTFAPEFGSATFPRSSPCRRRSPRSIGASMSGRMTPRATACSRTTMNVRAPMSWCSATTVR